MSTQKRVVGVKEVVWQNQAITVNGPSSGVALQLWIKLPLELLIDPKIRLSLTADHLRISWLIFWWEINQENFT